MNPKSVLLTALLVVSSVSTCFADPKVLASGSRQGWFPGFVYRITYEYYNGWMSDGWAYYNPQDETSSDSIWVLVPQSGSPSGQAWAYDNLADENKMMGFFQSEGFQWCVPNMNWAAHFGSNVPHIISPP